MTLSCLRIKFKIFEKIDIITRILEGILILMMSADIPSERPGRERGTGKSCWRLYS
jgi:hypothetical protein